MLDERLDDPQARLHELDHDFDALAATVALDELLADGRDELRRDRTDPVIPLLGAQLVELVGGVAPIASRDAHPSNHGRRDPARRTCEWRFDEGYALGRILLDTADVPLIHSPLSMLDRTARAMPRPAGSHDEARVAGFARLRALRRSVLREEMSAAFRSTSRLAPFTHLRSLDEATIDPALAAQLIGLGTVAAICEWSMVLDDDTPSAEILRLR